MLSIISAGYRYPGADRWAFQDVQLKVGLGEIVFLRGRNGTGKSTLLKAISGILEPSKGSVLRSATTRPIYMDQTADKMLAFGLTVREQLSAFHTPSSKASSPGGHLKEFDVGIDRRMDEFVGHLSGGQRQIVALLATIESGGNLLCLDEFLSALDSYSVIIATALIKSLVSSKMISVIAVSHSPLSLDCDQELTLDPETARP